MNTQKGYIIPIILVVLLLGLAGFFLFGVQYTPVADIDNTFGTTTVPNVTVSTTTEDIFEANTDIDVSSEDVLQDEIGTTSTSTSDAEEDIEEEI